MEIKITKLSESELKYIANLDYSQNSEKHYEALKNVIERRGIIDPDKEIWIPYEVVELCCNKIEEGHENEFYTCMKIIITNILEGKDLTKNLSEYILERLDMIEKLPSNYQEEILQFI
jgi:hypothetical protein